MFDEHTFLSAYLFVKPNLAHLNKKLRWNSLESELPKHRLATPKTLGQ